MRKQKDIKKMCVFFKAKISQKYFFPEIFLRVRTKSSIAITQVHCYAMNLSV